MHSVQRVVLQHFINSVQQGGHPDALRCRNMDPVLLVPQRVALSWR